MIYPVALLTADEAIFAGLTTLSSKNSYLYTEQSWWTMTPSTFMETNEQKYASIFSVLYSGTVTDSNVDSYYSDYPEISWWIRPSISLAPGTLINAGDGTSNSPYVIYENK